MNSRLAWAAICLLATGVATAATNEASETEIEGRNLAQGLLSQRPAENFTNIGTLKIRTTKDSRREIPVVGQTFVTSSNWQTLYFTRGPNKDYAAALSVIHTDGQPNEYRVANFAHPPGDADGFTPLYGCQAMISFAGSDFWLADLGLEFLHWPAQKVLKHEMKRGQACKVLESTNPEPATNSYARVVSWIDNDTGGIVQAEAFDAKGKLLKEFAPKGFKKVNGQWQLQEMEIRNVQTGSRTRLEFNLDKK